MQMEVNDDDEKDRLRFGMDEPDAWVRCDDRISMNMMCPVVMATSPDWDRTESEDDGLRFSGDTEDARLVYVNESYESMQKNIHATCASTGHSNFPVMLTGTPESFMVDEEPWVDDHTADDDGLLFFTVCTEGDESDTPLCDDKGWYYDQSNMEYACENGYTVVSWLPEDFEPAPEPEPVVTPPPMPETAPPTGWGDRPDEFAWTIGLTVTYRTFTGRLDLTAENPGDFVKAVQALISAARDTYKGARLW